MLPLTVTFKYIFNFFLLAISKSCEGRYVRYQSTITILIFFCFVLLLFASLYEISAFLIQYMENFFLTIRNINLLCSVSTFM